jgi:hypothetical protein
MTELFQVGAKGGELRGSQSQKQSRPRRRYSERRRYVWTYIEYV